MMSSAEIRQQFLSFFKTKQHIIVPSAPIVIKNDPTLLFTNAGMNQFKDYFLGNKKPGYNQIADTQKCLRVSGKHNDLEEVGVDNYHHTMFEMLGNWSIGDAANNTAGYFKKEAIAYAWQLLTGVYNIDAERLYVTIFEGDSSEQLAKDDEACEEWKKVVPPNRILLGNKKDNFWEMGDTGPCGPCTEIHYDGRTDIERKTTDGNTLVNNDHDQVIEIWNLVFIQYNRLKSGVLEPLPARHVDTGMGFERLVRVIQQKSSNYDTDLFSSTLSAIEQLTGKQYDASQSKQAIAFRVLADHIRAICFTIADGQLPANTGAGYVIRRILRRAVRYYYSYLHHKQPLLHQLVPVIAKQFKTVFTELYQQQEFVAKVVKEEEEAFLRTLEKGLKKMDDIIAGARALTNNTINGKSAFELFDTYGFPIDLTRLIADEQHLQVNEQEFESEMQQQKNRSRAASVVDAGDWIVLDNYSLSEFIGYHSIEINSRVLKYRKVTLKGKDSYQMVLETTPFYAESGGQVGDKGVLLFNNEPIDVFDTKKENNLTIHFTNKLPVDIGGDLLAKVFLPDRKAIEFNHTATHLLHAAIRQVLGQHVTQKGSLVNSDYLRFDFAHFSKVSPAQIEEIEQIVNEKIRANIPVCIKEMPKDDALAMGAMALFGEKYHEVVRVVIIDPGFSVELCGGTHTRQTGQLGFFKIKHETAVAAGVRRIEAVTGIGAEQFIHHNFTVLSQIKEALKNPADAAKAINDLHHTNTQLKKKIESFEAKQVSALIAELAGKSQLINGIQFIGQIIETSNAEALKKIATELTQLVKLSVIVLAAIVEGKAHVVIGIDKTVAGDKGLDAIKLIKEKVAPIIKGGGGGQKLLASAGGQNVSNLPAVIAGIKGLL